MPTIHIPTPMRRFSGGESQLQLPGATLAELIDALEGHCPGITGMLHDDSGRLKRFLKVFINSRDIRQLDGERSRVGADDQVHIVPAMAGGSV